MFRVTGILRQQCTRQVGTLSAVEKPFRLTADSHGAFAVEGVTVCRNAAAAAAGFFEGAAFTAKAAAGIDHCYLPFR